MIELGRKQTLQVVKKVEFGVYLGEDSRSGETERVLLPGKQVPEGTRMGDQLEVFIYKDSSFCFLRPMINNEPFYYAILSHQ